MFKHSGRTEEEHEVSYPAAQPGFKRGTFRIPDSRQKQGNLALSVVSRLAVEFTHPCPKGAGGKAAGVELTFSSRVVPMLRMRGAFPPLPHKSYAF